MSVWYISLLFVLVLIAAAMIVSAVSDILGAAYCWSS